MAQGQTNSVKICTVFHEVGFKVMQTHANETNPLHDVHEHPWGGVINPTTDEVQILSWLEGNQ